MTSDDRQLNLSKREEKTLEFWEREGIFEKTLAKTKRGKPFVFYEGPPTANAAPGIHHVEARAFKDIIPRYKTMRGFHVERKAGWDTHGLPVEIQVEKALGIKTKRDIERYGIAKFNAACRESVWKFKGEWEKLTKRIGYWLDLAHPYVTYETSYIESLWWIIKEFWKKKLLYQDFKVVPWCPRCETPLSTHELGLGYKTVKDRSVYVRFRVKSKDARWRNTAILSWTTTPWTLPGNVALAVNEKEEYVCIPDPEIPKQWIILGEKRFRDLVERQVLPHEYRSRLMLDDIDTFKGKEFLGLSYEPLFPVKELISKTSHRVYAADFVTMEEGTGVVHTAVMYGDDDYRLGKKVGLPTFHTVTETGHFAREIGAGLSRKFVKDPATEEAILSSLKKQKLLFREEQYEHEYPFCWRCDTPVLYYARNAWWVKTTAVKQKLLANNETINWVPEHLKRGRFGEFLNDVRDWAFSRERYWGTPLPVWQCDACEHTEVVGSLEDLDRFGLAPTTLVVMRHGQALHNVEKLTNPVLPANDRKDILTDRGKADVRVAAKKLARAGIQAIVASPSFRAQETAKIVAHELGIKKIETIPDLADIRMGEFELHPFAEFLRQFSCFSDRFEQKPGGAENLRELRARVVRAALTIKKHYAGKTVLAVTHGDSSWVLLAALGGLPEEAYERSRYLKPAEFEKIRFHHWPFDDEGMVNLHRPYVDELKLICPKCEKVMWRVPEVVDVWFDSGSMPFAQHHYLGKKPVPPFPADYISEAIDQTRGWFYTLLAVATLLGQKAPYRNVISLGHVLDKNGMKMSKSKGNVVNPWDMIEKYGADAIRWYFYTVNAPGDPKRFDEKDLLLKLRGALATFWNSFVFFETYVDKIPNPKTLPCRQAGQIPKSKNVLDTWVLVKLDNLTRGISKELDSYDVVGAARLLDQFIVEDFSNWYLRRSRRRFQKPRSKQEKDEAASVTGAVLLRVAELMAPFTPFLAEIVYRELKQKMGLSEESVHLREWPTAKFKVTGSKFKVLLAEMDAVRRIATLALAERAKVGIKVRQPLRKLSLKSGKFVFPELLELARDEANVKEVALDPGVTNEVELDTTLTAELREEGIIRELIRNVQEMRRDGGFRPKDRIRVQVIAGAEFLSLVERNEQLIKSEAGAASVEFGGKKKIGVEREVKFDNELVWLGIRKA